MSKRLSDTERIEFLCRQRASISLFYNHDYRDRWYSQEDCMSDVSLRRLIDRIVAQRKRHSRIPGGAR